MSTFPPPVRPRAPQVPPAPDDAELLNEQLQRSITDQELAAAGPPPPSSPPRAAAPHVTSDAPDPLPPTELERAERKYSDLQRTPAKDKNGSLKSIILNALHEMGGQARAVSEGAARSGRPVDAYGMASIVGAGGGGAAAGGINPALDEQRKRHARMDDLGKYIQTTRAQEKAAREAELQRAQIEQTRANARWLDARPVIEGDKAKAKQRREEQAAVFSNLRLFKGQQLNPANPRHAALLSRAADAGVNVDPDSWNSATSNVAYFDALDPDDPTKKTRMSINKATGEVSTVMHEGADVQTGYVKPVGKSGMTAYEEGSLGLSRERLQVSIDALALNTAKYLTELDTGITASAKRAFDTDTAGLKTELSATLSEVQKLQSMAKENKLTPDVSMERIDAAQKRVDELKGKIEAARSRALSTGGVRPRASSAGGGGGGKFTEAQVRAEARRLKKNEDAAVEKMRREKRLR